MAGRALVFSRPEVIARLQADFIPYAGDKWYLNRRQDADGAFFRGLGAQIPDRAKSEDGTAPQGIYIAAPDGALLAYDHFHPDPQRLLALLRRAEERWKRTTSAPVPLAAASEDANLARRPPVGGLILSVFSRIPLPPGATWTPNQATGRDHLWLTKEEADSLLPAAWKRGVRYPLPPAVAERLARFHLVDNVRGEPNFWGGDEIGEMNLTLRVEDAESGRLVLGGAVRLARGSERGYHARVQGRLRYDRRQNRWTRFDLLSWGAAWGEGTYTRGAPAGRFPLVIAAALAAGAGAGAVPPQASRDPRDYFGTGGALRELRLGR